MLTAFVLVLAYAAGMRVRFTGSPDYVRERARILRRNATLAERILWGRLRRSALGGFRFRRQQPLGRYIVDFCCVYADLIVEIDGTVHASQVEYDKVRDEWLASCGAVVLRFPNHQIQNPEQLEHVLAEIQEACKRNHSPTGI